MKNAVLIAFSLIFYAWGEPVWVILLVLTAFLDHNNALIIQKNRGTKKATAALLCSIITDIGIFFIFKYSAFVINNINLIPYINLPVPKFLLPVGISFYTFQTLTYVIDVYRGKVNAQQKFSKYLLYLSLYFQLVAGPIVRYTDVEKEIENRKLSLSNFSNGIYRFICGLGKKVIIANAAGILVDKYMISQSINGLSFLGAWLGIIMFTLQLYFDFSGYSDMAIGLGKMFGFTFPENFNYPYISKSLSEFWRRWHMTLGSFFRDYVYIPLGGNRKNVFRNLFIVWFLTGFWHGANWNFIIWGLYNGLFIYLEKIFNRYFEKIPSFIRHIYLIIVVNVGFVFFKFSSLTLALSYIKTMFGFGNSNFASFDTMTDIYNNIFWIILSIILCMPLMKLLENLYRRTNYSIYAISTFSNIIRIIILMCIFLFSCAHLSGNSFNPFLYNAF